MLRIHSKSVRSFGVPDVGNVKPILKSLSKIFGHIDKTVRAEGSSLTLALYTFLGPALLPSLADLKSVQLSELQKSFDSMDASGKGAGSGRPTRYTRKAQREREASGSGGQAEGSDGDAAGAVEVSSAPVDPKSFFDPVNVLSLFPSDVEDRLSSTKWKERLEALEECNKVLAQPANGKISDSNVDAYGSLTTTLGAKCKSDANVNVVVECVKLLEGLANGLGKPFGRFRGSVMPGMFERLKERKQTVTDALGKSLDAIFATVRVASPISSRAPDIFQVTLSDIVEDVLVALKNKNPQVRENTLRFLHRSLRTTTTAPSKDQVGPIAEILVLLLGDSTEPVRTAAADCLGTMMRILGERAFNPFVENVGDIQMTKVKDAFAKAEINSKAGGAVKTPAPGGSRPGTAGAVAPPMAKKVSGVSFGLRTRIDYVI